MAPKKPNSKTKTNPQQSSPADNPPSSSLNNPLQPIAPLPPDYAQVLVDLKEHVGKAQTKAIVSVNQELIDLYLHIGQVLSARIASSQWGDKVIRRLAQDLRSAFPSISGFSRSNLFYMCQVYKIWSTYDIPVQQAVRLIPWGHHLIIASKVTDPSARFFYLQETISNRWSRAVLTAQIETGLHSRQGRALSNFSFTLPPPQSDLAQQTLKDPYVFDFLYLSKNVQERDLEQGLIDHIQKFLLELGAGFSFVGRQFHLQVGTRDFYLDLLFYHLKLRCFVVVDLKVEPFEPEFAGKMNFYLSAVDTQLKHPTDQPSIGLLLCKSKDKITVEYALRDIQKPIGVSDWEVKLIDALPDNFCGQLPSVEDIEKELKPNK